MVLFNYATKELTAKIVYYGPGLCGKTTNLQFIHEQLSDNVKGKMLSLATKTDRTLFFDFLPMDLGEIRGMKTRMQLYTVPGQVFYNETRKLVLKGVDGIVFVADSQKEMLGPNIEAFKNLEENLKGHGLKLAEMPHVLQLNKRDLPKLSSVAELNAALNKHNAPFYESVATTGIGVQDTLKAITKLVLLHLTTKYDPRSATAGQAPSKPAGKSRGKTAPQPAAAPVPPLAAAPASVPLSSAAPVAVPLSTAGSAARVAAPAPAAAAGEERLAAGGLAPSSGELDDLVDQLQQAPAIEIAVDSDAEPAPRVERGPAKTVRPAIEVAVAATADGGAPLRLTDVVGPAGLFDDPTLEIARLAAGQERAILVPVELADPAAGGAVRRYALRVALRLDRAD